MKKITELPTDLLHVYSHQCMPPRDWHDV